MEKVILAFGPNFFAKDQIIFIVHFLNNFTDKNTIKNIAYGYNIKVVKFYPMRVLKIR
ncbi:Uncharacterised protein [Aggregatibacter aphrophilus]|uniref:Uncharacterized protein n=1 Tax=Aggregatibacter aphrophilus TaxID=732 RepID=A0A336N8F6_AGGAP|nr:Uncharacterised protein [Aggregatibacter aphrophilus]